MKRLITLMTIMVSFCLTAQEETSSSENIYSWQMDTKSIEKFTVKNNESYVFFFRNAKYQNITDIQSVVIGDYHDLVGFTDFCDSLLNQVDLGNADSKSFSFAGVEKLTLSKMLGKNYITLWDNKMLGYVGINPSDIKKFRKAIAKIESK